MATIDVKTEGLRELQQSWGEYRKLSSRGFIKDAKNRARRIAFALHREYQRRGAIAKKRIARVPASKMRPREGRSPRKEKAVRVFAAGFIATGWIPSIRKFRDRSKSIKTMANVSNPDGYAVGRIREGKAVLVMVNETQGAFDADRRYGLSSKALRGEARDMQKYIVRKQNQRLRRAGWR